MRHLLKILHLSPSQPALRGCWQPLLPASSQSPWLHHVLNNNQSAGFHTPHHQLLVPRVSSVQSSHFHRHSARQADNRPFILSLKGVYAASPPSVRPYLSLVRLDRPIGTWLLYLPCTWSISLAAAPGALPDLSMLAMFGLGAFLMRGAGCIINDMWDKDFDSQVARTKDRPLACGELSYFQALCLLGVHLSGSLAILLTMNWNTVFLGVAAMVPVITYPLMKRITYWPQAFLGLTFNWGALMGWSAIHGACNLSVVLPLYASGIAWTLVYDTIYAHQDKEDDLLIGVKSTALRFGDATKLWLGGFGSVMVGGLVLTGALCGQGWPYYAGVAGVAAHVTHQIVTVNLNDTEDCARKFRSNKNLGVAFWLTIMGANLLRTPEDEEEEDIKDV